MQIAWLTRYRYDGRDVHNNAALLSTHSGHHCLTTLPDTFDIDCKDALPFFIVKLFEGREFYFAKVGSVVNQAIDSAELIDCYLRHRVY